MKRLLLLTSLLCLYALSVRADHVPGRVLVIFTPDASPAASKHLSEAKAQGRPLTGKWRRIRSSRTLVVNVTKGQEKNIVRWLKAQKWAEAAELDETCAPLDIVPNDPLYSNQWHLGNIGAPAAWTVTTGSKSVVIAIIDTGCDPTHPDLVGNYVPGWNFYSNNSDSADVHGHGTHVAGVAAAAINNTIGVAGVANCGIMPLRVADSTGSASYSTIANALTYAADHGCKVANISFAGVPGSSSIAYAAEQMYNQGGITFVGAGNTGAALPTTYIVSPYEIVVGATDASNNRASFSSYGNCLDLAAPGVNMFSTDKGGGYGAGSGTSFASPCAAGVGALLYSANSTLSGGQVRQILFSTADDLGTAGWDQFYGWGKVNAARSVQMAATPPTVPDDIKPVVTFLSPRNGQKLARAKPLRVEIEATDNVGIVSVTLTLDNVEVGTKTTSPFVWEFNAATFSVGNHYFVATAKDAAGNIGTSGVMVKR